MTQRNGNETTSKESHSPPSGETPTINSVESGSVDDQYTSTVGRLRRGGIGLRHAEFVADMLLHPDKRDTESPWWKMFLSELHRLDTGMLDVLAGPRGRGKTALACMLLGHQCWLGERFRYTTAMDLLQHIKDGFGNPDIRVKALYATYPVLVIDEFHNADPSDWAHRTIESIIDDRYRNKRDTILITNDKPEQFVRQAGESIASRVKECGEVLVLSGRDYRERADD